MEKVRPWCGQPSDHGRLKNRSSPEAKPIEMSFSADRLPWVQEILNWMGSRRPPERTPLRRVVKYRNYSQAGVRQRCGRLQNHFGHSFLPVCVYEVFPSK